MRFFRNPETKGILFILFIALVLGTILAGTTGKLEQWGLPWFTGAKVTDKVAFVSDRSGTREVYMMNLDGSDQQQLTRGAKVLSAPAVSPKGNRIVFVGMEGAASHVLAVGVKGGTPYSLTASTGSKRQPSYSPDGTKLSYIERGRVFVADINGSSPDPALPTSEEMITARSNPDNRGIPLYSAYAWGPDSESMAGVSSQDRIFDTLSYLPKPPGELQQLTPVPSTIKVTGLAFASNKPVLAATLDSKGQAILILFDPETKQPRSVINLPNARFGTPAVSPDADVILIPMESTAGKPIVGLLKVGLEAGKAGMLVKGKFERPIYSPKGDSVVAARYDAKTGKRSVVSIDPTTGEVKELATNGDCFDASFSPMSKK